MNGGLIEGNSMFLIKRRVEELEKKAQQIGWTVTHVQGAIQGSTEAAVSGNLFIGARQFLFVWDPAKDLKGLLNVMPFTDDKLAVFMIHTGTTPERNKLKKAFPLLKVESHNEETRPWKKDEFAVEWVQSYLKELGTQMDNSLVKALVESVGNDLGFLRWEVTKANMLRGSNEEKITSAHVKKALAPISEHQPKQLAKAFALRNEKGLLRAAEKLRANTGKNETSLVMWTVSSLMPMVLTWAAVKRLQKSGVPSSLISQRLGISKWKIENVILPESRMWKGDELATVLKALSDAEQAVFCGAQSPWWVLVSSLVGSVRFQDSASFR